mgnify:CR=1 FL=1
MCQAVRSRGKGKQPNQRMQHFLVLQYLLEYSDENHFVSTEDLREYLKGSCEIYAERRSIYRDIDAINIALCALRVEKTIDEIEANGSVLLTGTDVEDVVSPDTPKLDTNQPMYNMLGQPVNATYRGIIIQNGNKYLIL